MNFNTNKYVLIVAALAVRKAANHRSEMIHQILFGEEFWILEENENWVYVRTVLDQYEGWIEHKVEYFELAKHAPNVIIISSYFAKVANDHQLLNVPFASCLGNSSFQLVEGETTAILNIKDCLTILETNYLGAPYLWGGKTTYGIDCSGLVQIYVRFLGKQIARDAKDQAQMGETILFDQMKIGDLVFFDGKFEHQVNHVGILCGLGLILHASGSVRKDSLHPEGIWNEDLKIYTHKYLFTKRI
ncbi:MAG: C40 family peptidase [Saprospiraceae bacterium]|nr:C40 family peptidase [Saprospiraceae bacterium]